LCRCCRTCYMFHCKFYFTCDHSFRNRSVLGPSLRGVGLGKLQIVAVLKRRCAPPHSPGGDFDFFLRNVIGVKCTSATYSIDHHLLICWGDAGIQCQADQGLTFRMRRLISTTPRVPLTQAHRATEPKRKGEKKQRCGVV